MQVEGALSIRSWDEQKDEGAEGLYLQLATVGVAYAGALVGESSLKYLMVYGDPSGAVPFVAMELLRVSHGERSGGFTLQHSGVYSEGGVRGDVTVVSGSGVEGFTGVSGGGSILWEGEKGRYTLDLEWGD